MDEYLHLRDAAMDHREHPAAILSGEHLNGPYPRLPEEQLFSPDFVYLKPDKGGAEFVKPVFRRDRNKALRGCFQAQGAFMSMLCPPFCMPL